MYRSGQAAESGKKRQSKQVRRGKKILIQAQLDEAKRACLHLKATLSSQGSNVAAAQWAPYARRGLGAVPMNMRASMIGGP